jgi:hypothetical protein
MRPAQKGLLSHLSALREAIKNTTTLKQILDDDWFNSIERTIKSTSPSHTIPADPTGLLYDFSHPLRGVDWFERDQALALAGRLDEIDENGKLAIAFAGLDPLRAMLPLMDRRLTAFGQLPFKQSIVATKLAELKAARAAVSFRNHLFELNVLGDLALRGVLVDIEDPATGVDGTIRLDGRDILVEATNTVQRVIPDFIGGFYSSPDVEIDQVIKKLRKKVAEGHQLVRAAGKPTVLFLVRTHMGAGRESADAALHEAFQSVDFSALSGVVLADSYWLYVTSWRPGYAPDAPLTDTEVTRLREWYDKR